MYDLNELEKKWLLYKRQKYKKLASFGAVLFGVAVASFFAAYLFFTQSTQSIRQKQTETNETNRITAVAAVDTTGLAPICEKPAEIQKEVVIVSPIQNPQEFKSFAPPNEQQFTQVQQPQAAPSVTTLVKQPAPKIQMETKTASHTSLLEERFKRNGDFDTALSLSEEYYRNGEYQKSLKWAVSANSLDSKNEKSWMLFAKSSYKLGHKQDAINALDNFTKTGGSDQSKTLLRQLRADEL